MKGVDVYICKRFKTADFPGYFKPRADCEEIVSVDCALFPRGERRAYDKNSVLSPGEQVLAVMMLGENDKQTGRAVLENFEFCGFDLAEGDEWQANAGISALTNCPGYFDGVLSGAELNRYGLLNDQKKAERLQKLLPERYPEEPHAYCKIYAVWRKV